VRTTLDDIRHQWEQGLEEVFKLPQFINHDTRDFKQLTVVLKDSNKKYHVHRYMTFDGVKWDVSADLQRGNPQKALDVIEQNFKNCPCN